MPLPLELGSLKNGFNYRNDGVGFAGLNKHEFVNLTSG